MMRRTAVILYLALTAIAVAIALINLGSAGWFGLAVRSGLAAPPGSRWAGSSGAKPYVIVASSFLFPSSGIVSIRMPSDGASPSSALQGERMWAPTPRVTSRIGQTPSNSSPRPRSQQNGLAVLLGHRPFDPLICILIVVEASYRDTAQDGFSAHAFSRSSIPKPEEWKPESPRAARARACARPEGSGRVLRPAHAPHL